MQKKNNKNNDTILLITPGKYVQLFFTELLRFVVQ